MIKVKDGYAKLVGTTASGSASHILLSNGGVKAVSDFAAASALDNYLPLIGGVLSGHLSLGTPSTTALLLLSVERNSNKLSVLISGANEGWLTHKYNSGKSTALIQNETRGLIFKDTSDNYFDVWHGGNDGSGSGLDADLLDGKQASDFLLAGNYLIDHGMSTSRPNGTTFTLPVGANGVSMRSKATSGADIGIFLLTDDNAFICNSSDNSYLFATFDTDKTADFSSPSNAAFAVLSDHAGVSIKGLVTMDGYFNIRNHYFFVRDNANADWVVTDKSWQHEYAIIHSGNIGSQSVNYASSAGALGNYSIQHFMTYDNGNSSYLAASFTNENFSKKAAEKYIEYWDSTGGWFNSRWGLVLAISGFHRVGSSDSYVLLGGGGHKLESNLSVNYANSAGSSGSSGSLYTGSIGSGGDSHASALQNYFNSYKTSIPRNTTISLYSSAYSNGSQYMGYFLGGYNDTPYGGFFVAHYDACYYVGISYGSYNQQAIITSNNIGSQSVNYATSAGSVAWGNITGKPSTFTPSTHYHNYFPENTAVYFRDPNNASWRGGMYWGSAGNEALCFAVVNANTSFRFFTGSDLANWTSSTWQGTPAFEVNKNGAYAPHFYESSDIRYKTIINNLAIKANQLANLPLFDFKWLDNEDLLNTGTSAQAVQEVLPYIVSGTDKLTLDYGVLGTIAGITACKELTEQEKEINELKEQIKFLKDEINNLKTNKLWQS